MNFQILPNWCKKLGVVLFVIFSFLEGRDSFIEGYREGSSNSKEMFEFGVERVERDIKNDFSFSQYFGEDVMLVFGAISIIGMIIYILSKEKVEDDYIKILRLESYQLSFLITTIISLVLYLLGLNREVEMATIISVLLGLYLIIFAIKKRTV